jgi:hypothetical protein
MELQKLAVVDVQFELSVFLKKSEDSKPAASFLHRHVRHEVTSRRWYAKAVAEN